MNTSSPDNLPNASPSPFSSNPSDTSVHTTLGLSMADGGHFDELRGARSSLSPGQSGGISGGMAGALVDQPTPDSGATNSYPTRAWGQFFIKIAENPVPDLNQRSASLSRQIRDNGVTYNVYADEGGPQRPWSLGLFPLLIEPASWQHIEQGVRQRMRLLEAVMADVYGPQQLLQRGLLPPALVQGHPGYLRSMHGAQPLGGQFLQLAAFDLARGPDGNWWVVSQRCQAPSGLGYLLENRLVISKQFPQAFESLRVQRLASTYRALMDSIRRQCPAGQDSHIALLTPGPYNETYFEHAYLARYLGLSLVEGSDLVVREARLYLKTLKGLVPVHGLLKRVDDEYLDPLELRADSSLGVPGLLQAIRAGHVLVANAPGSAFLESPALLGFLPALAQHLLGEALQLPALPTWWCGEHAALDDALGQLQQCVIKPTYPGDSSHTSFDSVLAGDLSPSDLARWAQQIRQHSGDYTVQTYLPLSQMPTWSSSAPGGFLPQAQAGHVQPRSVMLRVFAVSDNASDGAPQWRVLPGGLARVAGAQAHIATMQRGGSSADVWVLTEGEVDTTTLVPSALSPALLTQRKRLVTSRAAENLFWLGRYTERTENAIRLARLTLECLNGEDQFSPPLLDWLYQMALANTLVLPGVPSPAQARRVFERSLIASLGSSEGATSVGYHLRALKLAGSNVRERLSQEHWRVMVRAEEELFGRCAAHARDGDYSALEALQMLKDTSDHMAAITGAQTDRMTRDDGWRLLSIGRHIERLAFLSGALTRSLATGVVHTDGGFEAIVSLFDSTITFHARYQQLREMAALVDLLVLDRDNPRSLAWVAHTLRGRLAKLSGAEPHELSALALRVPDPTAWALERLSEPEPDLFRTATRSAPGYYFALNDLLLQCSGAAFNVSDDISAIYFTHSGEASQSMGTS